MLRFTQDQERVILANRRMFNQRQESMAQSFGLTNGAGLVGNALAIPRDVWGEWDREGISVQRQTMTVFNDLAAAVSAPMAIGKVVHYFQTISDSGDVNVSLDGRSKARTDKPTFDYHGTPIPVIDSAFGFGWREVEAARTEGFMLDDAGRMNSMYKVSKQLETGALDGFANINVNGSPSYGLRTHPKRNTRATGVALNGATGAEWVAEFTATLKLLHGANFKAPATIYVNWDDWFYAGSTEFTSGYPKKIAQAIMEIPGVKEVVPSDTVNANEIIPVIKDRRVVKVLNGMPMATRAQFRANPEDDYDFVTMAAAALEIKFDAEDNCGIAHSS